MKRLTMKQQKAKQRRLREQVHGDRDTLRRDMDQPGTDAGWGTSPGAMGETKRASEEARLVSCVECGYSAGRHSRSCSRADAS